MHMSATKMSEAIRTKRKKVREEGVEKMVDTAALPQMNPQDVWNKEKEMQREETIPGAGDGSEAPGEATMEGPQADDSQSMEVLKKRMARVRMLFDSL
jgi:hypothetical protein